MSSVAYYERVLWVNVACMATAAASFVIICVAGPWFVDAVAAGSLAISTAFLTLSWERANKYFRNN